VSIARQLCERETELRRFILPSYANVWRWHEAERTKEMGVEELAPGALAWRRGVDAQVRAAWDAKQAAKKAAAEARGEVYRRERYDAPGCDLRTTKRVYGGFVRFDMTCADPAVEASFTHWVRLDGVPTEAEQLHGSKWDCDYPMMCEWRDSKLVELSERWLDGSAVERMRAQKVRRSLEGRYAASTPSYEAVDSISSRVANGGPTATAGAHVLPKLLCGLYGGYFLAEDIKASMGLGPFLQLECAVDGAARQTFDAEAF
jgi:hypothetical protein